MEERTDQPVFELLIDQQIFFNAVHGHEKIDQFSAYTEVTTFEQRGEYLQLEGNILFTAYLERQGELSEEERIEHVEHRLPYEVAVPVTAQNTGMLNVMVQVPDVQMEILGPGWIHLQAVLVIDGLSSEGGVQATCGAQEIILPAITEQLEEWTESANTELTQDNSLSAEDWKKQLQGADRAFHGEREEESTEREEKYIQQTENDEINAPGSFNLAADPPFPDVPEVLSSDMNQYAQSDTFAAMQRSIFSSDSQVPILPETKAKLQQVETERMDIISERTASPLSHSLAALETDELQTLYTAVPEKEVTMTAAEWFWKTMNIPAGEARYTLKYRILQADESLEEIAMIYKVQLTELMIVNHLKNEAISPGEILYIPISN